MRNQRRNAMVLAGALIALVVVALVVIFSGEEEDRTVNMARADWNSGFMQAEIYAQLIGELGYTVTDPADHTLRPYSFYPALDSGQYDLWANGWFPTHDRYLTAETVAGLEYDRSIEAVGNQVAGGGREGYMIDKATADAMGITSVSQLADASVAAVFDQDGDGRADLIGCPNGWGCHDTINEQIEEFGWGANVEQVSGSDYDGPARGVIDRVAAGEPALFYAWTPNWTYEVLRPGDNVIWLESPWPDSSIRAVGNIEFLDDNPDIRRLLREVKIPLDDIVAQNARMASGEYTEAQVKADAAAWIAANRDVVDGWLATARG
ncbi:MAG: hypothetical protein F4Y99_06035 [Acidimicrobiaceae bacterium]|nr:hypothetical protein [Acidimicrobiaceae bacterium]MDE0516062.1 hypothetical protein [Acidimicrobiaceae bacterium]MDE0655634.1 hypothetical protein [Acidimicrobiaceae bacterium]MXZ95474.1 hypothetical protein [Acidimicrobiaceae bacterium]MYF42861.1 hypothetical protein [Acidimicrobiaceae bacterium]